MCPIPSSVPGFAKSCSIPQFGTAGSSEAEEADLDQRDDDIRKRRLLLQVLDIMSRLGRGLGALNFEEGIADRASYDS